jgi:hypothetical protein
MFRLELRNMRPCFPSSTFMSSVIFFLGKRNSLWRCHNLTLWLILKGSGRSIMEVLPWRLPGRTAKTLSQNSRYPGRNSNRATSRIQAYSVTRHHHSTLLRHPYSFSSKVTIWRANIIEALYYYYYYLIADGFSPGGSGNTVSQNTQNNPPRLKKAQHTKLHHNKQKYPTVRTTSYTQWILLQYIIQYQYKYH